MNKMIKTFGGRKSFMFLVTLISVCTLSAFNKASTETIKLIELALENKLAFIYLKGVRDLIDSAIKSIEVKHEN